MTILVWLRVATVVSGVVSMLLAASLVVGVTGWEPFVLGTVVFVGLTVLQEHVSRRPADGERV